MLGCHISTQFWAYQCLAESWIIKLIFTACVALGYVVGGLTLKRREEGCGTQASWAAAW